MAAEPRPLTNPVSVVPHNGYSLHFRPKPLDDTDGFEESKVDDLLQNLFSDLSVDQEENSDLVAFFAEQNPPPPDKLVFTRSSAFRIGSDFLGDDNDKNVQLLRCINVVVHAFETSCFL